MRQLYLGGEIEPAVRERKRRPRTADNEFDSGTRQIFSTPRDGLRVDVAARDGLVRWWNQVPR